MNIANVNKLEAECVVMDGSAIPCSSDIKINDIKKLPAEDNSHVVQNNISLTENTEKNTVFGTAVNTSLGLLAQYTGDSSEDDDSEQDTNEKEEDESQLELRATKHLFEKVFQQTAYRIISSDDE